MKRITKNSIVVFIGFCMLMLAACSSKATEEEGIDETIAEEAIVEEAAPVEASEPEPTSESTVEETVVEEPEKELYIPKGIDIESTLPGEEWVASFVGNVAEPVVVIFNDNSGRKEVVQANSEVTINPDEDVFAVYWNEDGMGETTHNIIGREIIAKDYYHIILLDSEQMREIRKRPAKVTVRGGAEDWVIEFKIIVK